MKRGLGAVLRSQFSIPTVGPLAVLSRASMATLLSGLVAGVNVPRIEQPSMATITTDFSGKVSGSNVECPHIARYAQNTQLQSPGAGAEISSASYTNIATLNATSYSPNTNTNGQYAQMLFSFNLIRKIELQYGKIPGVTTADKVAWMQNNLSQITVKWYGFGSSVGGNKAYLARWSNVGSWVDTISHTASSPTILSIVKGTFATAFDANGFMHFLAYADPSDGVTASTINTDYVSLDIQFKAGVQLYNPSVMVEEGTTNLLNKPNNFSDVAWTKTQITENGGVITDNVTAGTVHGLAQVYNFVAGTTYTIWADLSKLNGNLVAIGRGGGTDIYTDRFAIFDLNAGTVARQPTGTNSAKIIPLGNGVYRCSYTCTPVSASPNGTNILCAYASDGVSTNEISKAGIGNDRFKIYQAQVEVKPYATSFIDGTRANEVLSIPTTGILSPTQGTIHQWVYVDSRARRQVTGQLNRIFAIGRGVGGTEGIYLRHSATTAQYALVCTNDAGTNSSTTFNDSCLPDGWHLISVKWSASEAKVFVDGVLQGTLANPTLPSAFGSIMAIGSEIVAGYSYSNVPFGQTLITNDYQSDATILNIFNTSLPLDKQGIPNVTAVISPRIRTKQNPN